MGEKIEQKIGQIEALEYFLRLFWIVWIGEEYTKYENEKLNEEWREVESKSEVELKESGRMNGS